jgi:hypothetical protein
MPGTSTACLLFEGPNWSGAAFENENSRAGPAEGGAKALARARHSFNEESKESF